MEMPKVNEHHHRMQRLAGTRVGEEKMHSSPWGPGGTRTGRNDHRVVCEGFHLAGDYVDPSPARGRWEGDTLALIGRDAKNEIPGRYTFAFEGADRFRFSIENTRDGGKTWSTFMDALYKKTAPTKS